MVTFHAAYGPKRCASTHGDGLHRCRLEVGHNTAAGGPGSVHRWWSEAEVVNWSDREADKARCGAVVLVNEDKVKCKMTADHAGVHQGTSMQHIVTWGEGLS
jgi:hypothetical protein